MIEEMQKMTLGPDDVLIVTIPEDMNHSDTKTLKEAFKKCFPEHFERCKIIMKTSNISFSKITVEDCDSLLLKK